MSMDEKLEQIKEFFNDSILPIGVPVLSAIVIVLVTSIILIVVCICTRCRNKRKDRSKSDELNQKKNKNTPVIPDSSKRPRVGKAKPAKKGVNKKATGVRTKKPVGNNHTSTTTKSTVVKKDNTTTTYVGGMNKNLREGTGVLTVKKNSGEVIMKYIGEFRKGKREGHGIVILKNGEIVQIGKFEGGKKQGRFFTFKNKKKDDGKKDDDDDDESFSLVQKNVSLESVIIYEKGNKTNAVNVRGKNVERSDSTTAAPTLLTGQQLFVTSAWDVKKKGFKVTRGENLFLLFFNVMDRSMSLLNYCKEECCLFFDVRQYSYYFESVGFESNVLRIVFTPLNIVVGKEEISFSIFPWQKDRLRFYLSFIGERSSRIEEKRHMTRKKTGNQTKKVKGFISHESVAPILSMAPGFNTNNKTRFGGDRNCFFKYVDILSFMDINEIVDESVTDIESFIQSEHFPKFLDYWKERKVSSKRTPEMQLCYFSDKPLYFWNEREVVEFFTTQSLFSKELTSFLTGKTVQEVKYFLKKDANEELKNYFSFKGELDQTKYVLKDYLPKGKNTLDGKTLSEFTDEDLEKFLGGVRKISNIATTSQVRAFEKIRKSYDDAGFDEVLSLFDDEVYVLKKLLSQLLDDKWGIRKDYINYLVPTCQKLMPKFRFEASNATLQQFFLFAENDCDLDMMKSFLEKMIFQDNHEKDEVYEISIRLNITKIQGPGEGFASHLGQLFKKVGISVGTNVSKTLRDNLEYGFFHLGVIIGEAGIDWYNSHSVYIRKFASSSSLIVPEVTKIVLYKSDKDKFLRSIAKCIRNWNTFKKYTQKYSNCQTFAKDLLRHIDVSIGIDSLTDKVKTFVERNKFVTKGKDETSEVGLVEVELTPEILNFLRRFTGIKNFKSKFMSHKEFDDYIKEAIPSKTNWIKLQTKFLDFFLLLKAIDRSFWVRENKFRMDGTQRMKYNSSKLCPFHIYNFDSVSEL